MLIQNTEKKENSSKRYETSKWSFGNAILVTDWKTVPAKFHCLLVSIENPDDAQINVELYNLSNFFNQLFFIIWH